MGKAEVNTLYGLIEKLTIGDFYSLNKKVDMLISRMKWQTGGTLIEHVGFSVRTRNCLNNIGVKFLEELTEFTEDSLVRTRMIGRKSLYEIVSVLEENGLSLKENRVPK